MDPDLKKQAACRGTNPDVFFPVTKDDGTDNHGGEAKALCRTCPVWLPCLVGGLSEDLGIWGGFGENVRRGLKRRIPWCPHDPAELVDDCVWCMAVRQERDNLMGAEPARVVNRNSEEAVCGKGSTYSRGCRCPYCCAAAAVRTTDSGIRQRERTVA